MLFDKNFAHRIEASLINRGIKVIYPPMGKGVATRESMMGEVGESSAEATKIEVYQDYLDTDASYIILVAEHNRVVLVQTSTKQILSSYQVVYKTQKYADLYIDHLLRKIGSM